MTRGTATIEILFPQRTPFSGVGAEALLEPSQEDQISAVHYLLRAVSHTSDSQPRKAQVTTLTGPCGRPEPVRLLEPTDHQDTCMENMPPIVIYLHTSAYYCDLPAYA